MHAFPWARRVDFPFWLVPLVLGLGISDCGLAQTNSGPELSVTRVGPQTIEVVWPATQSPFELQRSATIGGAAEWRRVPLSPLLRGDRMFVRLGSAGPASFYRLIEVKVPFAVGDLAPTDGASEVGVTFRPKVMFTRPANPRSLTRDSFFAFAAGQPVPATVVPAGDGSFAWLFFAQPLPGGTRVRVVMDGDVIQAAQDGASLDGDGDGQPGGTLEFEFTTVSRISVPGTVLAGRVVDPGPDLTPRTLDDIGFGAQGLFFRRPIQGVKVFLLGMEDQFVFTDSNGWFRLNSVPVGNVKVALQGPTATTPHPGFYWPEMVMDSQNQPGITNNIQMIGQATNAIQLFLETVYLPRVASNILQNINAFQTNIVTLQSNALYDLPPEQQQYLTLEVMPNSLIGPNGFPVFNGQVGISVVPPELVRDMLPPGLLQHTFDITVQAPGVATFSTPAPMTFPNVFNAAPGTQLNLLSFDHTTGRLVIEGTATVSADGLTVRTDPGTGITHPGWHGLAPPGADNGPPCKSKKKPDKLVPIVPRVSGLRSYLCVNDQAQIDLSFGNAAEKPAGPSSDPCSAENLRATPMVVKLEVALDANHKTHDSLAHAFLKNLKSETIKLSAGQSHDLHILMQPLLTAIAGQPPPRAKIPTDRLYGVAVTVNVYQQDLLGHLIPKAFTRIDASGAEELVQSPFRIYIYRYVDVSDSDTDDGILEFAPALNDGADGVRRTREVTLISDLSARPDLSIAPGTPKHFDVSQIPGKATLAFDPVLTAPDLLTTVRLFPPDGIAAEGTLQLKGEGTPKFALNINKSGLTQELAKIHSHVTPSPQTVAIVSKTTVNLGGHFSLNFMGQSTAILPFGSSASEVDTALQGLSTIGPDNIGVSREDRLNYMNGGNTFINMEAVFTLIFSNSFAGRKIELIKAYVTGGLFDTGGNAAPLDATRHTATLNLLTESADVTDQFFSLGFRQGKKKWEALFRHTDPAATVQARLEALPPIGAGGVTVTRNAGHLMSETPLHVTRFTFHFAPTIHGVLVMEGTSNPLRHAEVGNVYISKLITPGEHEFLSDDTRRQAIADLTALSVHNHFAPFSAGISLIDAPEDPLAANAITVRWRSGSNPGLGGNSGVPGGGGIDNQKAVLDLVTDRKKYNKAAQAYFLAKGLNQQFTTAVEVYPNDIMEGSTIIPMELTRDQLVNLLGHVASHEAAHSIGASHTADAIDQILVSHEDQFVSISGGSSSDTYILDFVGFVTQPIPRMAPALTVANALNATKFTEGNFVSATGPNGGPFTIRFIGRLEGINVPQLKGAGPNGITVDVSTLYEGEKREIFRAVTNNTVSGVTDLMGADQKREYSDPSYSFVSGFSREILKMGLKIDWTQADAQSVLRFYTKFQQVGPFAILEDEIFDRVNDAPPNDPISGPRLAIFTDADDLGPDVLDFGEVLVDGAGLAVNSITLTLRNFGNEDIIFGMAAVDDPSASFQVVPSLEGTTLEPGNSLPIEIIFDPLRGGELTPTLRIDSNDPNGADELSLRGAGVLPLQSIQVVVSNNNVGGAIVGGAPVTTADFATIRNLGDQPLRITELHIADLSLPGEYSVIGLPALPVTLQRRQAVTFALSFAPAVIGLRRGEIQIISNDPEMPVHRLRFVGTGLAQADDQEDALDYGNDFVAIGSPDFPDTPALRTTSDEVGNFQFFLPPEQPYRATIFDPVSGLVAHLSGTTAPAGDRQRFGVPMFLPSTAPDTDGDGLPDDIEFAVGTDPGNADTDRDGLDDFTEIAQRQSPVGGRSTATGVIGRIALKNAGNLALHAPDPNNPAALHAYVADGSAGLTIVDVSAPTTPTVISSLPSLGNVNDVAVDSVTQMAVAVGDVVSIVDIADPARPILLRKLDFPALEVEAAGGMAYMVWRNPTNPSLHTLRSVDLLDGVLRDESPLPYRTFSSMTREANFLYLLGDRALQVVSFDSRGRIALRGIVVVPAAHGRFSVANGIACVPDAVVGGYSTVDIRTPDAPFVVQPSQAPAGVATPGAIASATGAGIILLGGNVGFGTGAVIDIMNGGEPTNTYAFVARFVLDSFAAPTAIVPAAGFGFVTRRETSTPGDILVFNYLGIDTRGQPPAIRQVEVLPDVDPAKAGVQILEGAAFYIRASLLDDVQVRSLELIVDGRVVQRTMAVPFDLASVAPTLAPGTSNITVQVLATDTGGNSVLSEPIIAELISDPIPRTLLRLDPAEGEHKILGLKQAQFLFSDSMGPTAAMVENFQLLLGGTIEVPITSAILSDGDRVLTLNFEPLAAGNYELIVRSPTIRDRAGNPFGASDFIRRFIVDRYSIRWVRNCLDAGACGSASFGSGSWFQPTNWFPARVPGPDDSVLIDTGSTNIIYIISRPVLLFGSGVPQEISVKSLDCKAQLSLHYISLRVEEPFRLRSRISLNASKLTDMRVLGEGSALITSGGLLGLPYGVTPEGYTVAFDRVHLTGNFKFHTQLNILNRLTLDGTLDGTGDPFLGESLAYGNIRFTRNAVLDGAGTLTNIWIMMTDREGPFTGLDGRVTHFYRETNAVVSFEPAITVRGRVTMSCSGENFTFINRGRIIAEIPHEGFPSTRNDSNITIIRDPAWTSQIVNEGLIEARNQDRLLVAAASGPVFGGLTNRGILRSTEGAYLLFSGNLVSSKITCDPGAYFELTDGSLRTAPGQISELSGGGFWSTEAMEFIGGTVRLIDGAVLEGDAIFQNVVFEGELRNYDWQSRRHELPPFLTGYGSIIQVRTNLTLNGTIAFRRALTNFPGYLVGSSAQAHSRIDGAGRLVFERANNWHVVGRSTMLDIGPGITIEAGGVLFGTTDPGSLNRGIRNAGTILADRPDSAIYINAFSFTNSGTMRLGAGLTLTNQYNFRQTAEGHLAIGVAAADAGSYGRIRSFNTIALDGRFTLEPVSGYQSGAGHSFEFLTANQSRLGQFATLATPPPPPGLAWLPEYSATNFVLRLGPAGAPLLVSDHRRAGDSAPYPRNATLDPCPTVVAPSISASASAAPPHSIARDWNEQILAAIRIDTPHPPVQARNLFSLSVCMYDAWAAYDSNAVGYVYRRKHSAPDVAAARREAISYAAYRMLRERYHYSRSSTNTARVLNTFMTSLGYRTNEFSTNTALASGVGNAVYHAVSNWFIVDGSRQLQAYADYPLAQGGYTYINPMLATSIPGISDGEGRTVLDINCWQRLMILNAVDQSGFPVGSLQNYLGAQWLRVRPFALARTDATKPWIDPGPPPRFGTETHGAFVSNVVEVIRRSSELTPDDGALIDISPGAFGNNSLGLNDGRGHSINPATGTLYPANVVKRGDFARVLAEFWADGPSSETPPGHWNSLANAVTDHPSFQKRMGGTGPVLDDLEWDVKMYFALNAAVHEAACAAWSLKRYYDGWRPISAVRYLGSLGQSTDPGAPPYHTNGLPLIGGLIEVVTESTKDGRHAGLTPGTIAILSWPGQPTNAATEYQGVKWIQADSWVPYQKANFVTPAFPGYVSGHSTFSRAAAEVLTELTGSAFFPGGMATYAAPADTTLTFERGPSETIELQWGTYYDAADQAGLSRIWGGIHPPADDLAGRRAGSEAGKAVWNLARKYFDGSVINEPITVSIRRLGPSAVAVSFNTRRGFYYQVESCPEAGRSFSSEGVSTLAHDSFLVRTNTLISPTKIFRAVRETR